MSDAAHPAAAPLPRHLKVLALVSGALSTLLGAVTSLGWLLEIPGLARLHPSVAPMVLNTALCFLLAGLALLAQGVGVERASRYCGAIIVALVSLTLFAYLADPALTIDRLTSSAMFANSDHPARLPRMAPNTATSFLLVGLALVLAGGRRRPPWSFAAGRVAGIAVLSLSTVALVGYLFGIAPAFGWGVTIAMSPQTALALVVIGLALVAVVGRLDLAVGRPRLEWLALLAGTACATVTLLLWQALVADHERARQTRLDAESSSARNAVTLSLRMHADALARLGHRWDFRGAPPRQEWEDDAGRYVEDFPGYEAVGWADAQARIRWVVPLAGNEAVAGRDLTTEGRRGAAVEAARSGSQVAVAGPVELFQGGRGFVVLVPLAPRGGPGGFMVAAFRGGRFLESVLSAESRSRHRISLLLAGEPLGVAAPESPLSSDLHSRSTWSLLGQQWSVDVVPTVAWASQERSALPAGALCGGLLFSGLLGWSLLKAGEARLTVLAQRKSESALQEAHSELIGEVRERRVAEEERDQFFSLSIDMLCISNKDGYFKRLNPAFEQTLGFTVEELTTRPFLDFVHPDDVAATLSEVDRQVRAGAPTMHFENRYLCKDGTYRWLAWRSMPEVRTGMMYALARDVTNEKNVEAEREQLIVELQSTLAQVRTLSSLLPMCSSCRRIQDDEDGTWSQLEGYLAKKKSGTRVSHGICPECMRRLYPDQVRRQEERQRGEKA